MPVIGNKGVLSMRHSAPPSLSLHRVTSPCFAARASSPHLLRQHFFLQGQHLVLYKIIWIILSWFCRVGHPPCFDARASSAQLLHQHNFGKGNKVSKHLISFNVALSCHASGCSAARAHSFHLLRQHLFHSGNIFYVNGTLALSNLELSPFLFSLVWLALHLLLDKPHKYYPPTTNPIMRAVKTSKPTALSVFITSGQDTIGKKLEKMDFCLKLNFQGAPVQPCPLISHQLQSTQLFWLLIQIAQLVKLQQKRISLKKKLLHSVSLRDGLNRWEWERMINMS